MIARSNRVRLRTGKAGEAAGLLETLPYVESFQRRDGTWTLRIDHAKVPELNRELVRGGIDVLELAPLNEKLEDVFLSLTAEVDRDPERDD